MCSIESWGLDACTRRVHIEVKGEAVLYRVCVDACTRMLTRTHTRVQDCDRGPRGLLGGLHAPSVWAACAPRELRVGRDGRAHRTICRLAPRRRRFEGDGVSVMAGLIVGPSVQTLNPKPTIRWSERDGWAYSRPFREGRAHWIIS